MRDRKIVVAYVLVPLVLVSGIVLYNDSDEIPDGGFGDGGGKRIQSGQGILVELALPTDDVRREQPDTSRPVSRVTTPPATHTARSAAGGGGGSSASSARPASVTAAPACTQSLLGSVLGLLGALLGGGGGC